MLYLICIFEEKSLMKTITQPQAKEPVRIRFKKLANNNLSIYLDTYINGTRTYEFLHLYLIPEVTQDAHIDKHVTFHTARHSFATMALIAGVDLYTISKLLGHRNIKNTTIYATVIDTVRDNATDSISQLYQTRKASK